MIGGSYLPFYVGRKPYLLAPVSIAEWETYELLQAKDMAWYLLHCSMSRADVNITKRQIKWFILLHKHTVNYMIKVICSISLPPEAEKDGKTPPTTKEIVQQVKIMYRTLSKTYGWTPHQISQMSPLQLYDYMTGGEDGTGVARMTPAQYARFKQTRNR